MRASLTLSIMMLLTVAGCSGPSYYWYHPDRTLEEAQADYLECREQARRKAEDMINEQHYDRLPPSDNASTVSSSLRDRTRDTDPSGTQDAWRHRYEQSALTEGMRAKGYLRLGTDSVPEGVHTKTISKVGVAGR